MATLHQEQLYNQIIEYYAFADRLIRLIEDSDHELSEKQFGIAEEIVVRLEDCADKIATHYIEFIKRGLSEQDYEMIRSALNELSAAIIQCRNKIMMLHQKRDS